MNILFLGPRFPLPTIKGDKLRAWHFIRALSTAHRVTLLTYINTPEERRLLPHVERVCHRVVALPFRPIQWISSAFRHPATRNPLQVSLYSSARMMNYTTQFIEEADAVHLNTLRMAANLPANCAKPLVVDFIDAISATYEQKRAGALHWFYNAEARRLKNLENALSAKAALTMAVSAEDAQRIRPNVAVVPHAVDAEFFTPPAPGSPRRGIVFTGNLHYPPNIEAAVWFARQVFPKVRSVVPGVELRLVGATPAPAVQALTGDGVVVTGYVPNTRDELQTAAVAVAPVSSGSGVKTKVLEAMACATPVVATTAANAGIHAQEGTEIVLAEEPNAFADAVIELLRDTSRGEAVGAAGRTLVRSRFSLEVMTRILLDLYARVEKEHIHHG